MEIEPQRQDKPFAFSVQRSAFNVQRSTFGVHQEAGGLGIDPAQHQSGKPEFK
jgi:hypothetical protein